MQVGPDQEKPVRSQYWSEVGIGYQCPSNPPAISDGARDVTERLAVEAEMSAAKPAAGAAKSDFQAKMCRGTRLCGSAPGELQIVQPRPTPAQIRLASHPRQGWTTLLETSASVPIPKFASACGWLWRTSESMRTLASLCF